MYKSCHTEELFYYSFSIYLLIENLSPHIFSLVCGDVEGNFNLLFKRVANVNNKNGPFSMLLCVGNFFGQDNSQWLPYKGGESKGKKL